MTNDDFIEQALDDNKLRPPRGHLWAEKVTETQLHKVGSSYIDGTLTSSGLLVPSGKSSESNDYLAKSYVVRALGTEPKWLQRFFEKEKDYKTTWSEQHIEVGTVVAARAVNGIEQDKTSHFIQLRYDEIAVIAASPGDELDMYPAPGWVILKMIEEEVKTPGGLSLGNYNTYAHGHVLRGKVYSLPRGIPTELSIGDIVFIPSCAGNGATEWVELGDYRAVPLDDILGVQEWL